MARRRMGQRTRLKPIDQEQARKDWVSYKQKPSEPGRNRLMETYLPVVKLNAERVHSKLPEEVELDDLISAGTFGLMDAIEGFQLERGIKFETYCAPRIRGAILDELRAMDWVPRLVRSRSAQVDQARRSIEMQRGFAPTDDEVRDHLGVDRDMFTKIKRDSSPVGTVSLSRKWYQTDSSKEVCEIDVLSDGSQANPLSVIQKGDLKDFITRNLTRPERLILILYYYEELTMKEIGLTLDLSESRVSQMHSSILLRLRAQFQHRAEELTQAAC